MAKRVVADDFRLMKPKEAAFVIEYIKDRNPRRAAEVAGFSPEYCYKLLKLPHIEDMLTGITMDRFEEANIDATWCLLELRDNHWIAREQGNLGASNTALRLLMQHVQVDAMARQKLEMTVTEDAELVARLTRGRQRLIEEGIAPELPEPDEVSFL